jgi:hypothetical protein
MAQWLRGHEFHANTRGRDAAASFRIKFDGNDRQRSKMLLTDGRRTV